MYCEKCGKQIEDDAKFCLYCGAEVEETVIEKMEDVQEHSGDFQAVSQGNVLDTGEIEERVEKVGQKKFRRGIVVATILAVVMVLAIVIGFSIYNKPENRLGRTLDLGRKYLSEEEYEQAIAAFTKAIKIDPNCAEAYVGRGNSYEGMGGSEENVSMALADYQMTLALDDTYTDAYIYMADIYIEQERYAAVNDILQQGLKKAGDRERIQDKLDDFISTKSIDISEGEKEAGESESADNVREPETMNIVDNVQGDTNVIYAYTKQELRDLLRKDVSDCTIMLDGIDYNVDWLALENLENITIQGTEGTRLISDSDEDEVIGIYNCKGLVLKNLVMGHDIPVEWSCTTGVLQIDESEISLVNCDIFGCGKEGFWAGNSIIEFENTIIRDCSESIMEGYDFTAIFKNCIFSGNGYKEPSTYALEIWRFEGENMLTFSECVFENNDNPVLLSEEEKGAATFDRCTFIGNAWD